MWAKDFSEGIGEQIVRVLPILFNAEMVLAILGGRKTVTRRCVKARSKNACGFYVTFRKSDNAFMGVYDYDENERQFDNPQEPPYQPGDILYVRETWAEIKNADGSHKKYVYGASDTYPFGEKEYIVKFRWHPSIHMPKEAARIWLKVTDVKVERLQDIDDDGAKEEGANCRNGKNVGWEEKIQCTAVERFAEIWDKTIKKSDCPIYSWKANPWVWVIEFEKCERPEG